MIKNKQLLVLVFTAMAGIAMMLTASKIEPPHSKEVRPSTVKPFELPEEISFAGEALPLKRADVREKLDREILVNSYWQSNNLLLLKRSQKYFPIIEPLLAANGIPDDFKYLVLIESGLQNVVSPAGAAGYWQIMKTTGKEGGLRIDEDVDERYDIKKSTQVACNYLKTAYNRLGDWTLAAASYNMGMSGAERRLEEQRVDSYFDLMLNSETARYVYRIVAVKHIHENLESFGYVFHPSEGYSFPEFDTVTVSESVDSWVDWAVAHNTTYNAVREYNPWIRNSKLANASGIAYPILIPKF
jgi:hypothetical protein